MTEPQHPPPRAASTPYRRAADSALQLLGRLSKQAAGLFPVVDEATSPDMYRLGGKIHFIVFSVMITIILVSLGVMRGAEGMPVFLELQKVLIPVCVAAWVLGALTWRVAVHRRTLHGLTVAIVVLDLAGTLLSAWATGPIQSHITSFYFALVVSTRAIYGFGLGMFALVGTILGVFFILALQDLGLILPMPLAPKYVQAFYGESGTQWLGFAYLVVMLCVAFVAANWAVVTLRFRNKAIRLLRASLSATRLQAVGMHTGRILHGTYRVDEFIGRGGMGEIYAGEHLRTKRKVAIKLLHSHLLEDVEIVERFKMEAEITGRLGSEHIVEVLDINDDQGDLFIVLELLEGQDLEKRLAQGPMSFDEVAMVATQAAQGLGLAHAAGIVHRDLKPSNLFLVATASGPKVKVLDFGISKIQGHTTRLTAMPGLMGTPVYMAPEQILSEYEVSAKTDQFALASIVYHCLAGAPPFEGESLGVLCMQICHHDPAPLRAACRLCPVGVPEVLDVAMSKDPAQRFDTVEEFAAKLAATLRAR